MEWAKWPIFCVVSKSVGQIGTGYAAVGQGIGREPRDFHCGLRLLENEPATIIPVNLDDAGSEPPVIRERENVPFEKPHVRFQSCRIRYDLVL